MIEQKVDSTKILIKSKIKEDSSIIVDIREAIKQTDESFINTVKEVIKSTNETIPTIEEQVNATKTLSKQQ